MFLTTKKQNIPDSGESPIPTTGSINITTSGVKKQLSGLKADKAYGPDGIPLWVLKENVQEVSKVLTDIYQDCIDTGTVPIQWKHANVCALHKKERNRILQTIGPCHLPASHQRYLSISYTAMS